ncbi:MAG: hypothetical protein ACRENB_06385 [Gemmatimonadales bacterium]
MRIELLAPAFVLCLTGIAITPATADAQLAVAGRISSLGVGAELSYRAGRTVGLRAAGNWLRFSREMTIDEVDYDFTPVLENGTALVDVYPFSGSFHVTGGVMLNGNEGRMVAVLNRPVTIGNRTYSPAEVGSLSGRLTYGETAPYLGLGFAGTGRIAFVFDLGVAFTGRPRAGLVGNTNLTGTERDVFESNVALEEQRVQAEIDERSYLKYHPVLSFGLKIRL